MEYSNYIPSVYKVYEDRENPSKTLTDNKLEADIQVAYLNMLHEKGLLADNIHSIALSKAMKGVI